MRRIAPRTDEDENEASLRSARGPIGRPRRGDVWGRPARFSARLLAWPSLLFLGATFATAACLVADCPNAAPTGPAEPITTLDGSNSASVRTLVFAADGSALASLDEDGAVEVRRPPMARRGLWPRATPSNINVNDNANVNDNNHTYTAAGERPIGPARAIALAPRGDVMAVSHRTAATALYRLSDRPPYAVRLFELDQATQCASAVAFSPDGQTLAVGQADGRTTLWNVLDGTLRATFGANAAPDSRLQIQNSRSPDTDSRSRTSRSQFLKTANCRAGAGAPASPSPRVSRAFVTALAFAPDGRALAAASGDRRVRIWDPADGRLIEEISTPACVCVDLEFTPDGRTLAGSGPVAPIVHLWDLGRYRERASLQGGEGPVRGLAISPDGRTLAAAGIEGRIDCWDLKTLERQPFRLEHPGAHTVAFSPDGRTLATGGFDGSIKLWNWRQDLARR